MNLLQTRDPRLIWLGTSGLVGQSRVIEDGEDGVESAGISILAQIENGCEDQASSSCNERRGWQGAYSLSNKY